MGISSISSTSLINQAVSSQNSRSSDEIKAKKLEYAQAISANIKNITGNILSSLGSSSSSSTSGLSSSLMYQVYDSKAITSGILQAYYDKINAAEASEPVESTSETTESDETSASDTQNTKAPTTSQAETDVSYYLPELGEGRGYDLSAVQKFYQDIQDFYDKPANLYKAYEPEASSQEIAEPGIDLSA